jgi:hypothetical protein
MKQEDANEASTNDSLFEEIRIKEEKDEESEIIQEELLYQQPEYDENDEECDENEDDDDDELDDKTFNGSSSSSFFQNAARNASFPVISAIRSRVNRPRIKLHSVVKSEKARKLLVQFPLSCPFCKKKSKSLKNRNEHVKYCPNNPHRIDSKCNICLKSFCDPYYVKKHLINVHGPDALSTTR